MKIAESSSKRVENTVEKGEIAPCLHFLLFPQCFQKTGKALTWVCDETTAILKNDLSLVLQIFVYLEGFECNTTSDWLNHSNLQIWRENKECL